jgi:hypothetical protein
MKEMSDSFFLQKSSVAIDKASDGKAAKDQNNNDVVIADVRVTSTPKESRERKIAIGVVNDWQRTTMVNITKVANTELVSSIGVEVTDTRAKSISDYGGAIVKVIGAAAAILADVDTSGNSCNVPMTYDIPFDGTSNLWENACIKIELGPLPPDAASVDTIPFGRSTSNYYYSACRDAYITIKKLVGGSNLNKQPTTVRVADPRFVQVVQLPAKGTITSHSQCGVSVVTQATAQSDGAAVADALATQAKAIKEAIEAAKK